MPPLERRASSLLTAAFVDEPSGSSRPQRVGGVALPYGQLANIGNVFQERFDPSAFAADEAAGWPQVQFRFAHTDNFLLASTQAATLKLSNDATGLRYVADLPRLGYVEDLISRGDLAGASVGFISLRDEWQEPAMVGELATRTVKEAMLLEVSAVPQGAYPGATVAITRSMPLVELAEARAGKRLSADSVTQITQAIATLRQLLGEDDGDGADDEDLLDAALERNVSRTAPAGLDAASRKRIGEIEKGIGELLDNVRNQQENIDDYRVTEIELPSGGMALMTTEPGQKKVRLPDGRTLKALTGKSMTVMSKGGSATPTPAATPKQRQRQLPAATMTIAEAGRRIAEREDAQRQAKRRALDFEGLRQAGLLSSRRVASVRR